MTATISPAEFGVLVDLALNANAPVGRVLQFGDLFQRAAKLANTTGSIGEIHPPALRPAGRISDLVASDVVLTDR